MSDELSDMLRVEEVARWLRVHPSTIYREIEKGRIPSVKIGKVILVRKVDLLEYVQGALRKVIS